MTPLAGAGLVVAVGPVVCGGTQRALALQEEERRHQELLQKRKEEEQERQRKVADAKRLVEQREQERLQAEQRELERRQEQERLQAERCRAPSPPIGLFTGGLISGHILRPLPTPPGLPPILGFSGANLEVQSPQIP